MANTEIVNKAIGDGAELAQTAVNAGKAWYKSRTFWANALLVAGNYTGYLPAKAAIPVAVGVNLGLRAITSQPLDLSSILNLFKR